MFQIDISYVPGVISGGNNIFNNKKSPGLCSGDYKFSDNFMNQE